MVKRAELLLICYITSLIAITGLVTVTLVLIITGVFNYWTLDYWVYASSLRYVHSVRALRPGLAFPKATSLSALEDIVKNAQFSLQFSDCCKVPHLQLNYQ